MEKPTDYNASGARIDAPSGDGLNPARTHDDGFKYQIPAEEKSQHPPAYEPEYQHHGGVGAERPSHEHTTGSAKDKPAGDMGERVGGGVRGVVAGIHGAGEMLRGGLNSAVDKTFGTPEGAVRNDDISRAGEHQIRSGDFSQETKNREGGFRAPGEK